MKPQNTTLDKKEVEKFSQMADEWWDPNGKFKPLHDLNAARIKYIVDAIYKYKPSATDLTGLEILDIGCGGGLVAEPFARLSANVTAIDASAKNIEIAKLHARNSKLDINYLNCTAEDMLNSDKKFDVIFALEIIEHVSNAQFFIDSCCKLLAKDGILFISTMNRNLKSFLMAIVGAEYILNWLPKGTHDWRKFYRPSEIAQFLRNNNLSIAHGHGIVYNIISSEWEISEKLDVNYILVANNSK